MKTYKGIHILPLLFVLASFQCPGRPVPETIPPRVLDHCPSKDSMDSYVAEFIRNYILCSAPNGTCRCGQGDNTWTQVGHLDMTNSSQSCPPAWDTISISNVRGCGRRPTSGGSCDSVSYSTQGLRYSQVCGRITAYQKGVPGAFIHRINNIDSYYLHGVSLTYGSRPREHVWSFVNAIDETSNSTSSLCPCMLSNSSAWPHSTPSFVGNDYFCATGTHNSPNPLQLYIDNPLWDGVGCSGDNTCCQFNQPPWFCRTLPAPTTDDLEVRICANDATSDENTYVSNLDLYVK